MVKAHWGSSVRQGIHDFGRCRKYAITNSKYVDKINQISFFVILLQV